MSGRGRRRGRGGPGDDGWGEFGGYMEAKKSKLAAQFEQEISSDEADEAASGDRAEHIRPIFAGVCIHVDGYTEPPAHELKRLMQKYGGRYAHYYSRAEVSHTVASQLATSKLKALQPDRIVVTPRWITDSLKAGKRLNEAPYRLRVGKEAPNPPPPSCSPSKGASAAMGRPEYIGQFYANSRLHHISAWAGKARQLVADMRAAGAARFPGADRLRAMAEAERSGTAAAGREQPQHQRVVMHIDMDCFFVSVALLTRPELRGKPVAVSHASTSSRQASGDAGGSSDRLRARRGADSDWEMRQYGGAVASEKASCGSLHQSWSEVASCSYAARACGVRNGMLLGRARELCPELVTVPYEFEAYEAASSQLYRLLGEFTHSLQAVSCDELFVDCGELLRETGASPAQLACLVRKEVQERTGGCTASCGLGPNLLVARLATKQAKPDGQRVLLDPAGIAELLRDLPVRELPGVGRALEARLTSLGFGTCGLLRGAQVSALGRELGPRVAQTLLDAANGRDDRPVLAERERKSISAEINYGVRFQTMADCEVFLDGLCRELQARMRAAKVRGRAMHFKAMVRRPDAPQETAKFGGHGVCNTVNKSVALPLDTDDARLLLQECMIIVRQLRLAPQDMRGLGIHMTRLVPATTGSGGSGSSGGGGRSMDISRFAKKVNPFAASGSAASSLSGATSSSMSGATSGFMSGATSGSMSGATSGSMSGATSGSMSVATSGSMSGATSGSMSGATSGSMPGATSGSMSGATSGSMSGVTSGSMSGATSGSMSGATSGSMSGATSGSMSGATSGSMSFSSASGTSSSNTFGGPSGATSGASGASGAKLLGRKASSNCYSNDRNKVTGKANFFANAAGPSLIEEEEGDERADSPAVPSAADCTQYDLSSALFDSGAPQIDEDFLAALPDSMATAIRAQLRDRDQNRDRDQDRDQVVPLPAASQLSQSCLAALPPEIRAELDAAYAAEERQRLRREQQPQLPPPPLRKAGRGRPKGSRNRTHAAPAGGAAGLAGKSGVSRTAPQSSRKKPGVKQLTVAEMFRRPQTAPPSPPPPLPPPPPSPPTSSTVEPEAATDVAAAATAEAAVDHLDAGCLDGSPPPLLLRPPSLCGRGRRLADLRRLLTDWTASAESPRPADERLLLRFFLAHLPDHLTRLYRLVRHFKSVAEAAGGGWAAACARLVAAVQAGVARHMSGSQLALC
ncbi:hypothetical protein BOX15_Mlig014549g2 [Macrostomum lignano]|uniref:DNA repair protein REV1 n=2 Tax=Macrostomum lignano TaxID=282301 RepID=A0A267EJ05_9PLAT|nr:hypothetical protein BOX15_Mlig014549g2 [Macrostomum lignano]